MPSMLGDDLVSPLEETESTSFNSRLSPPRIVSYYEDLAPAPLRTSRSQLPRPRTAEGDVRTDIRSQPIQAVGARSYWGSRPRKAEDPRLSRSVSPSPMRMADTRLRDSPPQARNPAPKYRYIPREYLSTEQIASLPTGQRKAYRPSPRPVVQPTLSQQADTRTRENTSRHRSPPLPVIKTDVHPPVPSATASAPQALRAPGRQPRCHVPSMIDYLTLKQLEDVWSIHDQYKGPLDVPTKPSTPVWRIEEELDPRSPLVHPAFRQPFDMHNCFLPQAV
ncbi:MAG: hypothetical protein MMC33_001501 [Icmadophila ericetorum]|nr:hypothetical protein [Icmadophila ericetorum]